MNHEKRMVAFLKGDGHPILSRKVNRNELCACGSGKKAKKCCGCETKFYHTKPKQEEVKYPDEK